MKAVNFTPDASCLMLKKTFDNLNGQELLNHLQYHFEKQRLLASHGLKLILNYKLPARAVLIYLFGALVEGIKERVLGPEINLEFALLTIRVYAIAISKLPVFHVISNSFKLFSK